MPVSSKVLSRAALVAAGLAALSPLAVATEHFHSLQLHAPQVLLTLGLFASCALAFRAAEPIDVVVGALAAGLFGGLGLAVGLEAWPPIVVAGVVFAILAVRHRPDPRREALLAPIVFVAVLVAVVSATEGNVAWRDLAPAFDGRARGLLAEPRAREGFALALWGPAALAIAEDRRDPLRVTVFATTALAFVLALVDPRFEPVSSAGLILLCAWTAARPWALLDSPWKRASWLGVPTLLIAALAWPAGSEELTARARAERTALESALEWLRERTASPGPFNHPEGAQDWRVLSAPRMAGSIAQLARRPTLAIEHAHRGSASAAEVAEWFADDDPSALAAQAQLHGARYLVVAAPMLRDPALPESARRADGLLERFLDPGARLPGWSLEFVSAPEGDVGASERALACVWRLEAFTNDERPRSSMSPRSSR